MRTALLQITGLSQVCDKRNLLIHQHNPYIYKKNHRKISVAGSSLEQLLCKLYSREHSQDMYDKDMHNGQPYK